MEAIRIYIDGVEVQAMGSEDPKVVGVEMWYDRHYRHWVIYPIDTMGYQTAEARYGFSRAEAQEIKADIEAEYGI